MIGVLGMDVGGVWIRLALLEGKDDLLGDASESLLMLDLVESDGGGTIGSFWSDSMRFAIVKAFQGTAIDKGKHECCNNGRIRASGAETSLMEAATAVLEAREHGRVDKAHIPGPQSHGEETVVCDSALCIPGGVTHWNAWREL